MMMSDGGDRMNGMMDGVMIAALHLSDGKNHSELASAKTDEARSLMKQRGNQRCAERKTDGSADRDAGAGEQADGSGRPNGIDEDAGEAVASGLSTEVFDLFARCF